MSGVGNFEQQSQTCARRSCVQETPRRVKLYYIIYNLAKFSPGNASLRAPGNKEHLMQLAQPEFPRINGRNILLFERREITCESLNPRVINLLASGGFKKFILPALIKVWKFFYLYYISARITAGSLFSRAAAAAAATRNLKFE